MATHSSILVWRTPWTEEPGGLQSRGIAKSQTQLKQLSTAQPIFSKWRSQRVCVCVCARGCARLYLCCVPEGMIFWVTKDWTLSSQWDRNSASRKAAQSWGCLWFLIKLHLSRKKRKESGALPCSGLATCCSEPRWNQCRLEPPESSASDLASYPDTSALASLLTRFWQDMQRRQSVQGWQTQRQASPTGLVLVTHHAECLLGDLSLKHLPWAIHKKIFIWRPAKWGVRMLGAEKIPSGCWGLVSLGWFSWRNFSSGSWIRG